MITFKNIHVTINGKVLFHNLSFDITRGDKVVLFGTSGSGKSTLAGLLLGFVEPTSGEIIFDGSRVDKKSAWDIRRKIAYVDQDARIGDGTVRDLIRFASQLHANRLLHINQNRISDLLSYFELSTDSLDAEISALSGGERQRAALVMALLLDRTIFILDEVTASLDRSLKKKVAEYFTANDSWTCMLMSHDDIWLEYPGVKVFDIEEQQWKQ